MADRLTKIRELHTALLAAIVAQAPAGTAISDGWPAGAPQDAQLWLAGDVEVAEIEYEVTGLLQHVEQLVVEARIVYRTATDTHDDVAAGAMALSGYVEAAVHNDPTLGGACRFARIAKISGKEAVPDDKTREMGLTVTVVAECVVT